MNNTESQNAPIKLDLSVRPQPAPLRQAAEASKKARVAVITVI